MLTSDDIKNLRSFIKYTREQLTDLSKKLKVGKTKEVLKCLGEIENNVEDTIIELSRNNKQSIKKEKK